MTAKASSEYCDSLNYGFLLIAHIVCADQQIHHQEAKSLRDLADQANVHELTIREVEKILGQTEDHITLVQAARNVPMNQRGEVLRQILAIAYIDGYFSPLEREAINQVTQIWNICQNEVDQILQDVQGFSQKSMGAAASTDDDKNGLSVGAQLLKGAESLLSKSLISKLTELAPVHIGEQIERFQREILLSGLEYGSVVQQCAQVAKEDFQYAGRALKNTFLTLQNLGRGLQPVLYNIRQKATGEGEHHNAKDISNKLEKTRQDLSAKILHDLESVRETLRAKQRSLNHFSVAFMGKTKAGKSTLHAIIAGEGWEAIGIGQQRTTRYNRVYEWKNIRIIDTPGIGAPGGKTDEEIAKSIIDEADVICHVVTSDSIQEAEFHFLKFLKGKTKPLIILLNIQDNLRDSRRLDRFLEAPDRLFSKEGRNGIDGHINRIKRYAQQHYANDYLPIIPVMLLSAQLAQEPEHAKNAKKLFRASRMQDFLDSIQISLIDHGVIRRSQTLLGSTVGAIDSPHRWICEQFILYNNLVIQLKKKSEDLNQKTQRAELDAWNRLDQAIKEVFQNTRDSVPSFSEAHWDAKEDKLREGWNRNLRGIRFEERLQNANEKASQDFQNEVRDAIEEIGAELKIIASLQGAKFDFLEQDTDDSIRQSIRIGGSLLAAVCTGLALIPGFGLPFLIAGTVFGILSTVSNFFKSRDQKRREAVQNISSALLQQIEEYERQTLSQAQLNFTEYCQSTSTIVQDYFEELIQGIEAISSQLKLAQDDLAEATNYLNYAYAKRIIDWATNQSESLTEESIQEVVKSVKRDFGRSIQIQTTTNLPFTKSQDEICTILQEDVIIQSFNS